MKSTYLKSIVFAYFGMLIAAAQQIITVPLIISNFGESTYGIYAVYFALAASTASLLGWLSTASAPLLNAAINQNKEQKALELYASLKFIHYTLALIVIPLGLGVYYGSDLLNFAQNASFNVLFLTALLYSVFIVLTAIEPTALFASARVDLLNGVRSTSQLLTLVLFVLMLSYFPALESLFVPHIIGCLASYLGYRIALKHLNLKPFLTRLVAMNKNYRYILFQFTSLAGASSILRTLIMLDPLLLALLINPAAVTEYTYYWLPANFIILSLWKFSENIQPFLMKAFARNESKVAERMYKKILLNSTILSILAAICYVIILPYFQLYWVGYESNNYWTACLFALYIVCSCSYRLDFAVLYSKMRYKTLLKLSSLEFLIKIFATVLLFGTIGYASSVAGHVIAHILALQVLAKIYVMREFRSGETENADQ